MENATIYEVLQLAIHLEEEGQKFYQKYANKATGTIKEALIGLAQDEIKHASYFKSLYYDLKEKPGVDYLFEEEVTKYFKDYAASAAFNRDDKPVNTVKEAIEMGIITEKNSIDYYEYLLKYSSGEASEMIKVIIDEEISHLDTLEKLLVTL